MRWEQVKLGDIADITSSKRVFANQYVDQGVPFYRQKEIIEKLNKQDLSEPLFISEELYNEIKRKYGIPKKGDLLITAVGALGIPYLVDESEFYFKDGNLIWLKNFHNNVYSNYLYYWIRSDFGQKIMSSRVIGSAQSALTIDIVKQIMVDLPPLKTQYKIVKNLIAYDHLIDKNQKQIKLLEEAAQRLYKEWFVDLRFPGHENVKVVDGVPEGWRISMLGELCTVKKETVSSNSIDDKTPYIGLEHMPRYDFCLSIWGKASEVSSNKFVYRENDIIFGKIRPYFHKVGYALNDGVVSTDSFVLKPNKGFWGIVLMHVFDKAFVNYTYQTCKEGTKMPRADWNQMQKYLITIPDDSVRNLFEKYIWILTRKIKNLALSNILLQEARDRLLPKLMSGEIEV